MQKIIFILLLVSTFLFEANAQKDDAQQTKMTVMMKMMNLCRLFKNY